MVLLAAKDIHFGLGGETLLDGLSLQIEAGERVCLLGLNGCGKTTLLRILDGQLSPDRGQVDRKPGLRTALLPQDLPQDLTGTVYQVTAAGLGARGQLLTDYGRMSQRLASGADATAAKRLDALHQALDAAAGWDTVRDIERVLSEMALDGQAEFQRLSAGVKRRVLLARALAAQPDLLLLDEPTNHLDLASIRRMEDALVKWPGAILFVTHDRALLQRLGQRILFLERGCLTGWRCDYATFEVRREAMQVAETRQNRRFDQALDREEDWLRQGVKARRRRNQGRLRALQALREAHRDRRTATTDIHMLAQQAAQTGKLVIEAETVGFAYRDQPILENFSTLVLRGDKVGIIGPNGCGKSTLLQILLGCCAPQKGRVRHGTHLQIAYFDQLRAQLDEARSVQENIADGLDQVVINGRPRHIIGYLKDFRFTPERARAPVRVLSGGERNRLLLAKLFARPANVLVLDEPTNDLDLETLELLEELLVAFTGTVLLVSHDRTFIDNVVTSVMAFEGPGCIHEYVGGYADWLRQRPQTPPLPDRDAAPARGPVRKPPPKPRKLSYRETRELEALPGTIQGLENEQAEIYRTLSDPESYQQGGEGIAGARRRLEDLERQLAAAYLRWEELDAVAQGSGVGAARIERKHDGKQA